MISSIYVVGHVNPNTDKLLVDNTRMAEGVVSRKKQLVPVVLGLLEE